MYVLRLKGGRCEHDRYYVGSTKDPQKRIADHLSGKGAKVTKRHPSDSIELESIKQMSSGASARKEETAVYLELKNKHGKDKVRGAVCRSCSVIMAADLSFSHMSEATGQGNTKAFPEGNSKTNREAGSAIPGCRRDSNRSTGGKKRGKGGRKRRRPHAQQVDVVNNHVANT